MIETKDTPYFHCTHEELLQRVEQIDPVNYARTRNYLDGAVTWLSPFITHGIINTTMVANAIRSRYNENECEKLLFELAWREFFHRKWHECGDAIFSDMKNSDLSEREQLPSAILTADTGIYAVDAALEQLFDSGSIHNHARMWVASICCNLGNTKWLPAARWMHYHLLDGDLASNSLSWQWIAGTFSNKRYFANQDNINKYSKTSQHGTFLDVSYEQLSHMSVPERLQDTQPAHLKQTLPGKALSEISEATGTVALRSVWHLDKHWQPDAQQQWLFIDEDLHTLWPMSENRWQFILHWANQIPNLQVVRGTASQLQSKLLGSTVLQQEYTACRQWGEPTESRTWLYQMPAKRFNSFFQFWKQVRSSS